MSKLPVIQLEAVSYDDLNLVCRVLNSNTLEYFTWVHFPECFRVGYMLYEVIEIHPNSDEALSTSSYEQQMCKPWIKFISEDLDLDVGQHIYRLKFVETDTNDTASLYFTYIIQNDNPDKPYVYMTDEES